MTMKTHIKKLISMVTAAAMIMTMMPQMAVYAAEEEKVEAGNAQEETEEKLRQTKEKLSCLREAENEKITADRAFQAARERLERLNGSDGLASIVWAQCNHVRKLAHGHTIVWEPDARRTVKALVWKKENLPCKFTPRHVVPPRPRR